ncbi:helix-turn-helix domain-containing protein [Schinkia azotoformans]|uniref:helix-turn-helix domain-containing protein n=1 Tax=Schinkia azotoformans TaxID=1454 RepID=UPI002DB8774D|nr:helix-turn-helix transcriptional regulator [Schinkia azotoformans]MEC1717584.1 helix-turn-helix transcriptional regulator [Schinkia azotoformans]MEC1742321.1 helix-turn-helix transcriptional regulator [Schinkia azotoformans]MEC1745882.1 helix-turn-helix transcriptional regulator [Schinkia azotoformans]MEC1760279.1 helix-turn-helix transcriptional regulator [Schinkia azotoformans]MEC1766265.1 helix-turn-helix transcriptional regulator [Schinkia azotoformans]
MERETAIIIISEKIKLIRTEQGYTQDKMAEILGLSKKTLVQIEKGRNTANWTTIVAVCALFNQSEILNSVLGDDPVEFIKLIGLKNTESKKEKTMGGKVWWKEISKEGDFRLQQNIISQHYRILDEENYRRFSTFNLDEAINRLKELKKE